MCNGRLSRRCAMRRAGGGPRLRVVATSREALTISREALWHVRPCAVPARAEREALAALPATRLYATVTAWRAAHHEPRGPADEARCMRDDRALRALLGDDACRCWRGWHHHMTLVILAHHFLVRLQGRLNQREGGTTSYAVPWTRRRGGNGMLWCRGVLVQGEGQRFLRRHGLSLRPGGSERPLIQRLVHGLHRPCMARA